MIVDGIPEINLAMVLFIAGIGGAVAELFKRTGKVDSRWAGFVAIVASILFALLVMDSPWKVCLTYGVISGLVAAGVYSMSAKLIGDFTKPSDPPVPPTPLRSGRIDIRRE